ncbi:MAG: hypothetical protein WCA84_10675 [Ignavibacteriaceae bacterium]
MQHHKEGIRKMKIIVTGSLGHISHPSTKELVQKGHSVTVISSKHEQKTVFRRVTRQPT